VRLVEPPGPLNGLTEREKPLPSFPATSLTVRMSYFKPVRSLVGEEAEKAARWERYNVSFGGLSKLLDDLQATR
jgi:hypothetical protein